jgi:hypothetical protein
MYNDVIFFNFRGRNITLRGGGGGRTPMYDSLDSLN